MISPDRVTAFFCSCTVAVSRQQRSLIIFGSAPILEKNHPWSTVIGGKDFTRIEDCELGNTKIQPFSNAEQKLKNRPVKNHPMTFVNSQKLTKAKRKEQYAKRKSID